MPDDSSHSCAKSLPAGRACSSGQYWRRRVGSNIEIGSINGNASESLRKFQEIMLSLVQLPSQPIPAGTPPNNQEQLVGKYVGLLPVLELPSNAAYAATALLGARALEAGQLRVANYIYEEVNFRTSNVTAIVYVMRGVGAFAAIVTLLLMLTFLMLLVASFHEADLSYLFSATSTLAKVAVASFFGCCGGVVSLLLRMPEFEILKDRSRTFLIAIGVTQPIMGGIFACVLAALISAKIINISVGGVSDLSIWLFVVLGFLAGFSERFTRNLLNVAASHLGGGTGMPSNPSQ
jgi:hypothetical protein